jgi:hypothetical protein
VLLVMGYEEEEEAVVVVMDWGGGLERGRKG